MMRAAVGTLGVTALYVGIALLIGYLAPVYEAGLIVGILLGLWISYMCERVD